MPDTFDSMSIDIGTLVPGLDEAIAGTPTAESESGSPEQALDEIIAEEYSDDESVDETSSDDEEKNISEESTQDSGDVDNEGKPNEEPDALGQALARLSALENENKSLRGDLETANVKLNTPAFIPFDKLPENLQAAYEARAEELGIDARHLYWDEFKEVVREHESKARALTSQREDEARQALMAVDKFFDDHPLKAKHGKLIPQLVNDMGWQKLIPMAQANPELFKAAGSALVDAAFRKAEADDVLRKRTLSQQKQLKDSTRSEASRAKPTAKPTPQKPDQGEISAKSMAEFIKGQSNPLDSFFR